MRGCRIHDALELAGRLGGYKYYDMDKAIAAAFDVVRADLSVDPCAN